MQICANYNQTGGINIHDGCDFNDVIYSAFLFYKNFGKIKKMYNVSSWQEYKS